MWDKLDLRIPFHADYVHECAASTPERPVGAVDVKIYDFPLTATVAFTDGHAVYSEPNSQTWDTISSGISDMAVGFFPTGNTFYPWPYVAIKASPAKILQGHNVFGSEDIRPGLYQMLSYLSWAFPRIYQHLDLDSAEVRYLDSTYSAFVPSEYARNFLLKTFENLFPCRDNVTRDIGYLLGNKGSKYRRQKIYYKAAELEAQLAEAVKTGKNDRAAILGNPDLIEFAKGRMRFEATTGHAGLESQGIPTRLREFLKFHDWFESVHKVPLCRYLWHLAFDKFFDQMKGHTMKQVDDESIKLQIEAKYLRIKEDGSICRRKANAIFKTYRQIKSEGYEQLLKDSKATLLRNVALMEECGISRAFLKSLCPNRPTENVIPLLKVIEVDFSRQRPDWYQEPKPGFEDSRRHLRLVS